LTLKGSNREAIPDARIVGDIDPNQNIEVSVYIRPTSSDNISNHIKENSALRPHERKHLSYNEFQSIGGASNDDVKKVESFAQEYGLEVKDVHIAARRIKLRGTAASFNSAFGVKLEHYEHDNKSFRGRKGEISIPKDLQDIVVSVHGLDNRPQVKPHFKLSDKSSQKAGAEVTPQTSTIDIANKYNFPPNLDGTGQCIAILEFGGGSKQSDLNTYFRSLNIPMPNISNVSVDGAQNAPGDPADGEVVLDIEVAGAVAPKSKIVVYFAPNSDQGFIDAVTTAIHDQTNKPSIISISWGLAIDEWTPQTIRSLDHAFKDATTLGVTIFAASGDDGSRDNVNDGKEHVDFPSCDPYVAGTGGTTLRGSIQNETAWSGGGGGVTPHISLPDGSIAFELPDYQSNSNVPLSPVTNKPGRGVPDVAGDADPSTGYNIFLNGEWQQFGGTSAVAPLWSGLIARINQGLGTNIGFINPLLYTAPANAFNDIKTGSNDQVGRGNFQTRPGWDAVTGLGTPNGVNLLNALRGQ